MASPIPQTPLEGHCSVIYDNTLYVYSPNAFQALPLQKGAKWSKLQNGVPVSGAACVRQSGNTTSSSDALWVVGGASADPKSSYPGLQKYTFSTKKWETISLVTKVTKHRQAHASVYLPASGQLLVYAGSQDDPSIPTTDTFLIGTSPPYPVSSYSGNKDPVIWPQLLQWDDNSAITLGGIESNQNINQQILKFDQSLGKWKKIRPSLKTSLKSSDHEQATLIQATDGSKVLQLYDLSVSPNTVTQFVLQEPNGRPAPAGQVPGQGGSHKRKRKLTLNHWPAYNSTFASKKTRSEFGIAQSSGGLVAISGGNSGNEPLELFDQTKNSWVDCSTFFGIHGHQTPVGGGGNPNHPPSPSPSNPSSSNQDDNHPQTSLILGATLGSILGFIALLIIFLLLLRWRRQKERREEQAREREEKDRLSFADRGDPFMKEISQSGYHPHEPIPVVDPAVEARLGHRRSETRGSEHSTTHLVPKKDGAYPMNDVMEMGPIRENSGLAVPQAGSKSNSLQVPGQGRKRTSGWSRYFSGADMLSVGTRNSQRTSQGSKTPRGSAVNATNSRKSGLSASSTRSSRDTYPRYSQSIHDCRTHGPTEIPPLDMGQNFDEGRIGHVVTGNNVMGGDPRQSTERPRTVSSTFSTVPPSLTSDTRFSHENQEETTTWTPVTRSDFGTPGVRNTATSSIYAQSTEGGEPPYKQGPRISGPTGTSTIRTVSGAAVVQRPMDKPIIEEGVDHYQGVKPSVAQVVTVPVVRKPLHATVQDDLRWIDLGGRS